MIGSRSYPSFPSPSSQYSRLAHLLSREIKKKGAPRNRPNIIFFINDDQVKEEAGPSAAKNLSYVRGGKWRQEQAIIWGANDVAALTFCEVPIRLSKD